MSDVMFELHALKLIFLNRGSEQRIHTGFVNTRCTMRV